TGSRNKVAVDHPSNVAFDSAGRLYVVDQRLRTLVFFGPLSTGVAASRVLGLPPTPGQGQTITFPNEYNVGACSSTGSNCSPAESVFTSGETAFVVSPRDNRILKFDSPIAWPGESTNKTSPKASGVLGQNNSFTTNKPNAGNPGPTANGFSLPTYGVVFQGN